MTSSLRVSPSAGPPAGDRFGWIIYGGLGSISTVIGVTMLFQAGDAEGLIAGAVFTVAGIGMIAAGVWIRRVSLERHTLQQRDPARPWRWRQDWVAGRIESDARRDSIVLWSFTLLWNLMSLPVWFGMAGAAIFFAWIFPAIGLVLLSIASRCARSATGAPPSSCTPCRECWAATSAARCMSPPRSERPAT